MEIQPRLCLRGSVLLTGLAIGAGRVEIEITHIRQPGRIVAHRQGSVDFTPLRLDLRAAGDRLRHQTDVVPLLTGKRQRRRTQHNALGKEYGAADFIRRPVLKERQPLSAIHRWQIEFNPRLVRQRREPLAVRSKDCPIQRQLMVQQPAAVDMILRADGAGQVEAAQTAGDVNFDRHRLSSGLIDRRR